jgi:hypothetical protein
VHNSAGKFLKHTKHECVKDRENIYYFLFYNLHVELRSRYVDGLDNLFTSHTSSVP